jgi:molybdate transport system permease protein
MSLGSSPSRTFFTVTIPMIRTGLITGLTLSWARALGEFGATITFAGDNPERTRTLPLELFVALESDPSRAIVLGMIMVTISLGVLITLRGRWMGQR